MSLIPVDDAIRRIIDDVSPLPPETVSLTEADGRRLAAPLVALTSHPPFAVSAMDGYAIRSADIPASGARLRVIGMAAAGHHFAGKVAAGDAVRIFTGAPLPEGADAILIQENAEALDDVTIVARESVAPGRNVRPSGLDFGKGDVALPIGAKLGMRELALAAALGHAAVSVIRRPSVAILATGDELVPPGAEPGPDQIVASNSIGVAALVRAAGGHPVDLGIARDQRSAIEAAADRATADGADVLVTLGGASVGEHDLVRQALEARGMVLNFWKIAMRPGKPLMSGRLGGMRVLGLPGNPVSSLVCALLFLKPLIEAFLGASPSDQSEPAVLGGDLPPNDNRQDYVRALLAGQTDGPPVATAFPVQDSSMLSVLARAGCLIIRPPHAPAALAGELCRVIRLP